MSAWLRSTSGLLVNRSEKENGGSSIRRWVVCSSYCNFAYSALACLDGDVGVSIFPEREEIFVGSERPNAGGIGIGSLRGSRLQGVGASHAQMRQGSRPAVPDDAAVVEDFLELGGGCAALSGREIRLAANVGRIEAGDIVHKRNLPVLDGWQAACRPLIAAAGFLRSSASCA